MEKQESSVDRLGLNNIHVVVYEDDFRKMRPCCVDNLLNNLALLALAEYGESSMVLIELYPVESDDGEAHDHLIECSIVIL